MYDDHKGNECNNEFKCIVDEKYNMKLDKYMDDTPASNIVQKCIT